MEIDQHSSASASLSSAKRVVVKIGSSLICDPARAIRHEWMAALAIDVDDLRKEGTEVLLVSSGAVAIGRQHLGLSGALRLEEKQAASAAGQASLIGAWQAAFAPMGIITAQILLTLDDTEHRRRYLNARATLSTLLEMGAVPVVNENDTIATSEIRYGDNDRLAAHTAQLVSADLLVMLSDVDGLYNADPRTNPHAKRLDVVASLTPDIEAMAGGANLVAGVGTGGMASKIAAAKIAGTAGCASLIADGRGLNPLRALLAGASATLIEASQNADGARRQWISGRLKPAGSITIDDGAATALKSGASLLPAGVRGVEGEFRRGDAIIVLGADGREIAQGLSTYDACDIRHVAGQRSDQIAAILGYSRRPAIVEKDDLVLRGRAS